MAHYDPYNYLPQNSLGYLLRVNHSLMQDCAERILAPHGMSFVQWVSLLKLNSGMVKTASDLCRNINHDNGALTRVLDQLEKRGFILRERSKQDRRVVNLQLTEAGRLKIEVLTPLVVSSLNTALEPFSADEFAELTGLLEKLHTRLKDYSAEQQSDFSREAP